MKKKAKPCPASPTPQREWIPLATEKSSTSLLRSVEAIKRKWPGRYQYKIREVERENKCLVELLICHTE